MCVCVCVEGGEFFERAYESLRERERRCVRGECERTEYIKEKREREREE